LKQYDYEWVHWSSGGGVSVLQLDTRSCHLQATFRKLLTYCVLRPTQPATPPEL